MIPATYPSQLDTNNTTQMVVYYLSSVTGLERWKDYIPVKETPLSSPELNSFNTNGAIYTTALSSIVGKQAWVDYIPVYEDSLATDAWTINAVGYLTTKSEVVAKALAVIASYGTDAHVYLPGIGIINGLTAGNYLDSAGTTAATVDNPVGLVLDGSGGQLGTELTAPAFNNATLWTPTGTATATGVLSFSVSGGAGGISKNGNNYFTANKYYDIQITYSKNDAITSFSMVQVDSAASSTPAAFSVTAQSGTVSARIFAVTGGVYFRLSNTGSITISSISVKEVTGIHALQATTANKPILRRGAVNLLTYSEQFDNAAWGKLNTTISQNSAVAPDGTTTMDKLVETAVSGVHYARQSYAITAGTAYTFTQSVYVKQSERNVNLGFTSASPYVNSGAFNPTTGQWVTANNQGGVGFSFVSRTATLTGDIWRVSLTISISTSSTQTSIFTQINLYNGTSDSYLGDGTSGIYIWGAQLQTGSVATDYVATTTAAASSSTGNYWWQFDGSNDSLALSSVPFQMADDHCVVAGANVSSSAIVKTVFCCYNASARVAQLRFSAAGLLQGVWLDTTAVTLADTVSSIGNTVVASCRQVGTGLNLRKNGALVQAGTRPTGTTTMTASVIGNFPTASEFYTGGMYPVIAIKGTVTDADLLTLERFVGRLSGVTI